MRQPEFRRLGLAIAAAIALTGVASIASR